MSQRVFVTVARSTRQDWWLVEEVFKRDGGICVACDSNQFVACVELVLPYDTSQVNRCITLCERCTDDASHGTIFVSEHNVQSLLGRFEHMRHRYVPFDDLSSAEKKQAKAAMKILQGLEIRKELK